jgi:hypothetical protein
VREELPPPLPPETRTVGQLVAESIRFYQDRFWQVVPLGLVLAVVDQLNAGATKEAQIVVTAIASPLITAAYIRAVMLVVGGRWSWTAFVAGTLIFLPVPFLIVLFILPAVAWLALFGMAVPVAVVARTGFRESLARGRELGRIDFVHALGSIATLGILYYISESLLILLLRGQADLTIRFAMCAADLVLSPLLFVGSALLYVDQRARLEWDDHAPVHPPLDALDAGRADAEGEPGPAAGSQP